MAELVRVPVPLAELLRRGGECAGDVARVVRVPLAVVNTSLPCSVFHPAPASSTCSPWIRPSSSESGCLALCLVSEFRPSGQWLTSSTIWSALGLGCPQDSGARRMSRWCLRTDDEQPFVDVRRTVRSAAVRESAEYEVAEFRCCHLLDEACVGEGPRCWHLTGVEVPAVAAGDPHRLLGRRAPFFLEAFERLV